MRDCENCRRLNIELREAREELDEWRDRRGKAQQLQSKRPDTIEEIMSELDANKPWRAAFGLSPIEARFIRPIHENAGRPVSRQTLFERMKCKGEDWKIVDVVACRVRAKMTLLDLETIYGVGYQMPTDTAAAISQRLETVK